MRRKFDLLNRQEKWKDGDVPVNAEVAIVLNAYGTGLNGEIIISQNLASPEEVDAVVDDLIKDLRRVQNLAKKQIKKTNEKVKKSVSKRISKNEK